MNQEPYSNAFQTNKASSLSCDPLLSSNSTAGQTPIGCVHPHSSKYTEHLSTHNHIATAASEKLKVSPRKIYRTSRIHHIQRPCLDFEKMQQVRLYLVFDKS